MARHYTRLIGLLLAAVLLLSACSSAPAPSQGGTASPGAPRQVVVGINADTRTLEPLTPLDAITTRILRNLYDPLFFRDENMALIPWLAKSATMNADTTWTIELNQGVKFSDGTPFTAQDVVANLEFILDTKNNSLARSLISYVTKVEAVGDYTVKLTTKSPYPDLPTDLTDIFFVPAKLLKEKGIQALASAPVGTGPFMLDSWKKDQEIVLKANPTYFKGAPTVDKLVFRVIPEVQSRLAALMAGEIDIFPDVPPEAIEPLKAKNIEVKSQPGRQAIFIATNTLNDGPLKNKKVRQALNYATDVDSIIKNVLMGYGTRMAGPLLPINAGNNANLKPYSYDPEKAKKLLAEAGYANGLTLTFNAPKGRYLKDFEAAQTMVKQWEKVGVTAKLQTMEWATYLQTMKDFKMVDLYMNARSDRGLVGGFLPQLLKTRAPYNEFSEPALDPVMDAAVTILDNKARQAEYNKIQEQLWDLAPWVFLWQQHDLYAVGNKVNWNPRADQQMVFYNATIKSAK